MKIRIQMDGGKWIRINGIEAFDLFVKRVGATGLGHTSTLALDDHLLSIYYSFEELAKTCTQLFGATEREDYQKFYEMVTGVAVVVGKDIGTLLKEMKKIEDLEMKRLEAADPTLKELPAEIPETPTEPEKE